MRLGARSGFDQPLHHRPAFPAARPSGRLTSALAYNPFAIGIGLDEDSAAFISPDQTLEVGGSGAVTVVDATDLEFSSMDQADEGQPVCMLGLRIHILIAGSTYNLHTRLASPGSLVTTKK